jgi:hypothetical protein
MEQYMGKDRKKLKAKYKELYGQVSSILFKHDMLGINFEDNTDEYGPEVDTILPRLSCANSIDDVSLIIYEEFLKWFDEDCIAPKGSTAYKAMATEIWAAWESVQKGS